MKLHITKYSSTLYIGMDKVFAHYACTLDIIKGTYFCIEQDTSAIYIRPSNFVQVLTPLPSCLHLNYMFVNNKTHPQLIKMSFSCFSVYLKHLISMYLKLHAHT